MTRGRRRELDGVRGLAILLVLIGHGAANYRLSGLAAAGVTLFFALSGYLITGVLTSDRERHGRINLRRFYLRRATRLGPPLILMLVIVSDIHWPGWRAVLAPMTWTANYFRLAGVELYPFDHTWSLGVEEQFYLLWPLAVGLIFQRRWSAARVVGWAFVVFTAWRVLLTEQGHLIYAYGTLETAGSTILAGALVALAKWRLPGWYATVATGVMVLVGLAAGYVTNGWLIVPLVVTPACAVIVAGSADARWLRFGPLTWCGLASYSMYLWHEPISLLVTHDLTVTGVAAGAAVGVVAYLLVERPIARARALGLNWRGRARPIDLVGYEMRLNSAQQESAAGLSIVVVPPPVNAIT